MINPIFHKAINFKFILEPRDLTKRSVTAVAKFNSTLQFAIINKNNQTVVLSIQSGFPKPTFI